ncbi:hypothetical protein QCD60_01465 [Pokkaliibacter sp. MBI-7]|uniref:hypothetical protein n=1 Tax=Pokkaliibacter sp. MBI-7 TaxID=3040600 RepID=UPI002446BA00|nr:hypothetical protein [Pokkaliibacter sp. MBI-7]MDH2431223.1 hypothetical protein [Pokkaliibacter sp. MBI-7]
MDKVENVLEKIVNRSDKTFSTSTILTGDQLIAPESRQDLIDDRTKQLINLIFARFAAIYGHKFESMFSSERAVVLAKREWALSLRGVSEQYLVRAVDHCKETLSWMPTIAEFLAVVRNLGNSAFPEAYAAYEEACMHADRPREHVWSHPVVFHAGRQSNWYQLRRGETRIMFKVFAEHYRNLCQRAMDGESFVVPINTALPDKTPDTLFAFIARWGEQHQFTPEQAHTLLFYLTKPKGSGPREVLLNNAKRLLEVWHRADIILPDAVA